MQVPKYNSSTEFPESKVKQGGEASDDSLEGNSVTNLMIMSKIQVE